jgi:DNA-binding transcriptional MocR family regulator
MSESRRRELAAIARSRDLFLVEDAANRMLVRKPPRALRDFAPERTFLVASVSKVLTPGLRVAFVVGPRDRLDALSRIAWATHWMPSPIGAEIVSMWLEDGTVERTLELKRREAVRRQAVVRKILGARSLSAHRDSLHMWLRLPSQWRVDRFADAATKQNIIVTPSTAFWTRKTIAPSAIRISLGGLDDVRTLADGLDKLRALLRATSMRV